MLTETQLAERKKFIGSSDSAAIVGLNPWATAYDVWASKTGRVENFAGNAATEAGDRLEDAVVNWGLDQIKPIESRRAPAAMLQGVMGANLDADALTARWGKVIVEGKTAGITSPLQFDQWGDEWTAAVPDHYQVQVQHQLAVAGPDYQLAFLAALLGSRGFVLYAIPRDQAAIDALIEACESFWANHVLTDTPPDASPSMEVAKRLRRTKGKQVAFDARLLLTWTRAKDELKAAKDAEEKAKAAVIGALGDADAGVSEAGTVTYYEQSRAGYEVQPCSFRVLRTKGNR